MKKLLSRKFFITLISIVIATVSPLWINDSGIYYGLVAFLASASGLYSWANNMAKINR